MAPTDGLWPRVRCISVSFIILVMTINYTFFVSIIMKYSYRDGRSRAGVYCAANACIEQVIQHGEVDVFQAVKTVRRHRPQLVENMVLILNILNIYR